MSSSKLDKSGVFGTESVKTSKTTLSLTHNSYHLHKNGMEFVSSKPFPLWHELTVDIQPPGSNKKLHFHGVVISCDGNKAAGYVISLVFTEMSRLCQERLNSMVAAQH